MSYSQEDRDMLKALGKNRKGWNPTGKQTRKSYVERGEIEKMRESYGETDDENYTPLAACSIVVLE